MAVHQRALLVQYTIEIAEILLPSIGQFQLYIAVYVQISQEWNVGGLQVCWTAAAPSLLALEMYRPTKPESTVYTRV